METQIKKYTEQNMQERQNKPVRLFNPECMHINKMLRVKSIEATEEYTRIDFIYRASNVYVNGGWIQMDPGSYIQPVGSNTRYGLIQTFEIPIFPVKHYFTHKGEIHVYTLIFPALPKNTSKIHIIEKEAPGNYFNFYNVDFSEWMTIPHAADIPISNN